MNETDDMAAAPGMLAAPDITQDIAPDMMAQSIPDQALRLAEALIFASAEPVSRQSLAALLPDVPALDPLLHELRQRYAGRGVELVEVAGGWQFRSAPDLSSHLRKVVQVPRRLPKAAMETLAVIAYHQPVTRAGIEEVRGVSLSQSVLDGLLEAGLVSSQGRKDVPGRPTLWGTTPVFLQKFGLNDLRDLPRREDLMLENAPDARPAALEAFKETVFTADAPIGDMQADEMQADETQIGQRETPAERAADASIGELATIETDEEKIL